MLNQVSRRLWLAAAFPALLLVGHAKEVTYEKAPYLGWSDAVLLRNALVEVVVVPSIGRIMDFRFKGEAEGVFWRNEKFHGKPVAAVGKEWGNFGGDKPWPAPQSSWPSQWPISWPPPLGFDQTPLAVEWEMGKLVLTSPVEPVSGICVVRELELLPGTAELKVRTIFQKKTGKPFPVSVWTITQLKDPLEMTIPLRKGSKFPRGYHLLSEAAPGVEVRDGVLHWKRDQSNAAKVGADSTSMTWMGKGASLTISMPYEPTATYPDDGCSVEIYTNGGELAYVELECLSPLKTLTVGESNDLTVTYRLEKRP